MPDTPTPTPPDLSPQSDPEILRKEGDRDPLPEPSVGTGDTSAILDKTRDLGEDK